MNATLSYSIKLWIRALLWLNWYIHADPRTSLEAKENKSVRTETIWFLLKESGSFQSILQKKDYGQCLRLDLVFLGGLSDVLRQLTVSADIRKKGELFSY